MLRIGRRRRAAKRICTDGSVTMRKTKAFTLIELLVVIAIVAILLAILIPALNIAKKQAAGIICMANLNGMGKAWAQYIDDNDARLCNGHVPRDAQYASEGYWQSTTGFGGPYDDNAWWVDPPHNQQGTYTGDPVPCPLEDEDLGNSTGTLASYLGGTKILHCPADRTYLFSAGRGGKRTYSIQDLMHGERPRDPKCADKFNEIITPGDKFVFLENTDDRGWNMGSWMLNYGSWQTTPASWIDTMAVFHNDRNTFCFADGHAEKHKWEDGTTISAAGRTSLAPNLGRDLDWLSARYVPGRR